MDYENCLHLKMEDLKPWAYQKVKAYANIPHLKYWYNTGITEEKYIPINEIVGTYHYNYGGDPKMEMTWFEVLLGLKQKSYVEKDILIKQICSQDPSPHVGQFGNEYYILGDGNNRLCKARFLNLATFYCRIDKYLFHTHDFNMSTRLEKLGFSFNYNPSSNKKFDMIEYNDQLFFLDDDGVTQIQDFVEAVELIRYTWFDRFMYSLRNNPPFMKLPFIFNKGKESRKKLKDTLYYNGYKVCKHE